MCGSTPPFSWSLTASHCRPGSACPLPQCGRTQPGCLIQRTYFEMCDFRRRSAHGGANSGLASGPLAAISGLPQPADQHAGCSGASHGSFWRLLVSLEGSREGVAPWDVRTRRPFASLGWWRGDRTQEEGRARAGRDIRPVHSLFSWGSGRRGRPVLPQAGVSRASERLLVRQSSCSAITFRLYRCARSPGAHTELQRVGPPLPPPTSPPRPLELHCEAF